jgi:hypothetical protein
VVTGATAGGSQGTTGADAGSNIAGTPGTSAVSPPAASQEKSSIRLTPKSQGFLESTDKQISVIFPAGAVISETDVITQQISPAQLPPSPRNAKPSGTCFKVDGLNGLLSKEATITVKYTNADLDSVGGDASSLVLARWDEGDSRWTFLPTTVDANARTLVVTTNRLSIWAVMALEGPAAKPTTYTPGPEPLVICGTLAVYVIIAGLMPKK